MRLPPGARVSVTGLDDAVPSCHVLPPNNIGSVTVQVSPGVKKEVGVPDIPSVQLLKINAPPTVAVVQAVAEQLNWAKQSRINRYIGLRIYVARIVGKRYILQSGIIEYLRAKLS